MVGQKSSRVQLFPAEKLIILSVSFFSCILLGDYLLRGNREVFLVPVSLAIILIFFYLPQTRQKYRGNPVWLFFFSALTLPGYAYLYKLAGALVQFLRRPWQDELLVRLDVAVFGFSPNLALSGFQPAWLTELMMFSYLAYLPLVAWLAYMLFRIRGQAGLQSYAFTLGLAYLACFLFFILVPASSPRFYFEGITPEGGFLFRRLMNLVETSAQYRGGSFPSAHCAAGTVMLYFSIKAGKKVAPVVIPLIILFFISTVYGQYHYAVDVLAGIVVGLAAIPISKMILRDGVPGSGLN
ncbi:MAG: phosphatase PAP2 family protein [Candidatus Aminicenantes bacterium]|nr:phosphatase PAP2 family protein [Candidatus Aminicenantes bacterium]